MLHPTVRDRSTLAFDIAAKLELYETLLERLAQAGVDHQTCLAATRQMAEIARAAVAMPQLRSSVIELALQHLDLLRALAADSQHGHDESRRLRAAQGAAIREVRARCVSLLTRH